MYCDLGVRSSEFPDDGAGSGISGPILQLNGFSLDALKEFRHDIFDANEIAWEARTTDQSDSTTFAHPDKTIFNVIQSESIDYAVIGMRQESKRLNVQMAELNAGWNDLGVSGAVWQVGQQDEHSNVTSGDAIISSSKNSLIHSSSRLVCAVSVDNLIVVKTADAALVIDKKIVKMQTHRQSDESSKACREKSSP